MKNPLNDSDHDGQSLGINGPESSKEEYYNKYALRMKGYKFTDFEDYLSQVFAEGDGACVLDDDFPDAYQEWSAGLEYEDYIRFGNIYGRICKGQSDEMSKM